MMEKETPTKPNSAKRFPIFPSRSKLSGKKRIFLVVSGILTIGFILVGFIALRPHKSAFGYSTKDIVYGEKVIARNAISEIQAPEPSNIILADDSSYPSIQVSDNFFDFGSVSSNKVLTHTFFIANTGSSALIIQQALTTCGCTLAEISSNNIPPGKVALVTLQFDPSFHNMSGTTVRRGVIIYTNDPKNPIVEIWIQATVK